MFDPYIRVHGKSFNILLHNYVLVSSTFFYVFVHIRPPPFEDDPAILYPDREVFCDVMNSSEHDLSWQDRYREWAWKKTTEACFLTWAGPWENVSYVICEQQRCRSACASTQSDQHLCCSLLRQYNISRFYSQNFKTLASFCGCAGQFVSGLVGNSQRHVLSCCGSTCISMGTLLSLQIKWVHFQFKGYLVHLSHVTRKPVFGVCNKVRLKPACSATENSCSLGILDLAGIDIIFVRTTKALIRQHGCTGWSVPFLSAYGISRISHDEAHFILDLASVDIILYRQGTTKALIRLRGCAGWSAPLLCAYGINRFPHDEVNFILIIFTEYLYSMQ